MVSFSPRLFGLAVVIVGSLATFLLTIAILIIAEVAICVVTLTKRTELGAAVESMVNRSFFEQFNDTTVQSAFHWMEDELDCCGANDVSDYWKLHKPSNCEMESYTIGCAGALSREFRKFTFVLPVVAIVFGLLQFLAVAGACCLASAIKRQAELV
ncbi:hypothetical protein SprV_0200654700 [Sparganum proliferum]